MAEEPCAGCGLQGVLFSKRQMKIDPLKRKCLDCMASDVPVVDPTGAVVGKHDPVKPVTVQEPCAGCGRVGVPFSTRQAKVDAAQRKCLECMPGGGLAQAAMATKPRVVAGAAGARMPLVVPQRPIVPVRPAVAGRPPSAVPRTSWPPQPSWPWLAAPAAPRPAMAALGAPRPFGGPQAPRPPSASQGNDPVKPATAPEPCSGCGRQGALFSKRQLKIDASARKCLECMGGPGAEAAAEAAALMCPPCGSSGVSLPKPSVAAEPCVGCGRTGVLFSKRQIKLDASKRRCLDCMPAVAPPGAPAVASPLLPLAAGGAPTRKRTASAAGISPPALNASDDVCSACGRAGQAFSNRQMKVDASKRRCIACMPGQPRDEVAEILASEAGVPVVKAAPGQTVPPKENVAAEPCSKCGRVGVAFSNRQMKVDAVSRRCLECMGSGNTIL